MLDWTPGVCLTNRSQVCRYPKCNGWPNLKGMTEQELLRHITRSAGNKAGYKQLVRELGLGGGAQRRRLLEQLDQMTLRGELVKVDREHWAIKQKPERAPH